jgi:competence protein ComEC
VWCALWVYVGSLTVSVSSWGMYLSAALVLWLAVRGRALQAVVITAASVAALFASSVLAPLPEGPLEANGVMSSDVIHGRYGPYALIRLDAGLVLADLPGDLEASRGDHVSVEGTVVGGSGVVAGRRHRGTVRVDELSVVSGPASPFTRLGNAIRKRVLARLAPVEAGRGLLAGFLVGDTDGVDPIDQEAMRRSGLSHFTAVSGSNIALFLTLLYVIVGPLGVGPRRRAVIGLLALPVFAAATRFEPSVLRASAMAGILLGGRLAGVGLEPWQVISAAVIGLLVLDPALAANVGFQLSVAAAAGVMIGGRWPVGRRWAPRALAVTLGAQAAVAPILVASFGSVPLLSPLANLLAAPVVTTATVIGIVGTIGPGFLIDVAAWLAEVVLALARVAAGWPQIGWTWLLAVAGGGLLAMWRPRLRSPLAIAGALITGLLLVTGVEATPSPGVVVLDVGQGDAILLAGGDGEYALVDGGPDPVLLIDALRRYGVRRLRFVVLSHTHADHATGLVGLVGRIPIGRVWADTEPHTTALTMEWYQLLEEQGIPLEKPVPRQILELGQLKLTVEAPMRRYASPNDQSVVLMVEGPERSMLLTGDIEAVAQSELGDLRADVLKVPHQGAATSDLDWLADVGSELAVISVGPNDFGHPSNDVIHELETSGSVVLRTDHDGDVPVPLG